MFKSVILYVGSTETEDRVAKNKQKLINNLKCEPSVNNGKRGDKKEKLKSKALISRGGFVPGRKVIYVGEKLFPFFLPLSGIEPLIFPKKGEFYKRYGLTQRQVCAWGGGGGGGAQDKITSSRLVLGQYLRTKCTY